MKLNDLYYLLNNNIGGGRLLGVQVKPDWCELIIEVVW